MSLTVSHMICSGRSRKIKSGKSRKFPQNIVKEVYMFPTLCVYSVTLQLIELASGVRSVLGLSQFTIISYSCILGYNLYWKTSKMIDAYYIDYQQLVTDLYKTGFYTTAIFDPPPKKGRGGVQIRSKWSTQPSIKLDT